MKNQAHYDIIADIHGRFDKLSSLMARLGYQKAGDGFAPPPGHKALFLGDLIDPKPGHMFPGGCLATLRAAKAMCDRGDALCLMGNHEFNAICYHTRGQDGKWLRIRGTGNVRNHSGTLADFPDHENPASEWQTVWLPVDEIPTSHPRPRRLPSRARLLASETHRQASARLLRRPHIPRGQCR